MRLSHWYLVSVSIVAASLARAQAAITLLDLSDRELVVFGDSLSDDGHGSLALSNGSWPADPAYAEGRFTDGRVWAEHAADALGLSLRDNAVGGATSDNRLVRGGTGKGLSITSPSLLDQVAGHHVQSQSVHCVLIGLNDLYFKPDVTAAQVVANIRQAIATLQYHGAEMFVLGIPYSLGDTPYGHLNPDHRHDEYAVQLRREVRDAE